jgi:hypothetical protein
MAPAYPAIVGNSTDDMPTSTNGQRKIVRVNNGTLHAVWDDDGDILMANSTDDGKTWSFPFKVSDDNREERDPAIATNGTNLYVSWSLMDNTVDHAMFRRYEASTDTWHGSMSIYSFGNMRLDVTAVTCAGSHVYVGLSRNTGGNHNVRLIRSDNYGSTFTGWSQITNDGSDNKRVSVASWDNEVYIVYQSNNGGPDYEIWIARSQNYGTNWGGHTQITSNTGHSVNPCITNNGTRLFVTWEDDESGEWDVHYRYTADYATWDPALGNAPLNITASQTTSIHPTIVHEDNATYILWEDDVDSDGGDIYISVNDTGNFASPIRLTRGGDVLRAPNACINITNDRLDYVYSRVFRQAPHDVLYDFYSLSGNTPQLQWLGQGNYQTDGLDPEGDTTGHTYTYMVDYVDATNSSPMDGYPQVWIDRDLDGQYRNAERHSMDEVDAGDTTYTDGKTYTYSTTLTELGTYTYRFQARNDDNIWATGAPTLDKTGPVITSYNVAPRLEWTEELGYEFDGIEPDEGMTEDIFTYRIEYIDDFDEAPAAGFPKVLFDMDGNGNFTDPGDEEASMLEETAQDTTYWNGKIYTYERNFTFLGDFNYKFVAEDVIGLYTETAPRAGPVININTTPPVLDWADGEGFTSDGVDPNSGSIYTEYVFRVNYSDANDEAPMLGAVEIGIDIDINDSIEPTEWFLMEEEDPADDNYTDGKTYIYKRVFSNMSHYKYSFRAYDINGAPATGDPTGEFLFYVNVDNSPPVLKWTSEENYTSDGVNPQEGTANLTEFVFRVKYEDIEGNLPIQDNPQVGIDLDLNGSFEEDEFFAMSEVSEADDDVTDGKLFTYTHIFDHMGTYSHTFRAADNFAAATGSPTGVLSGPDINDEYIETSPPILQWVNASGYVIDGVEPNTGFNSTPFVFKVEFVDADNDMVDTGSPKLLIDLDQDGLFNGSLDWSLVMTEEDVADNSSSDGKVYFREVTLDGRGEFNYTFEASSARSSEDKFMRGQLSGIVIVLGSNSAPTLAWAGTEGYMTDGVHPDKGEIAQLFNFKVKYTDPDNDPPATKDPKVSIDLNGDGSFDPVTEVFDMTAQDPSDLDFTDGKIYWKTGVAFSTEDIFKYEFSASDSKGAAATSLGKDGPEVAAIVVNQEPIIDLVGISPFVFKAVEPIHGDSETTFEFKIVYMDPENDMPADGHPRLILNPDGAGKEIVGSVTHVLEEVDPSDTNSSDGKFYNIKLKLEEGDFTYSFDVINDVNQTAMLGPFDGPIVVKKGELTSTTGRSGLGDMTWILILIIAIVVGLLIGIMAGRSRRPKAAPEAFEDTEPRFRESRPLGEMDEEEMPEEEPYDEEPGEDEERPPEDEERIPEDEEPPEEPEKKEDEEGGE